MPRSWPTWPSCRGPVLWPAPTRARTKAKPEIWTEQAKFKENNDKLVAETAKLSAAAKTGNLDAVKTAFAATAGTCKACHDAYRQQVSPLLSSLRVASPLRGTGACGPAEPDPTAPA